MVEAAFRGSNGEGGGGAATRDTPMYLLHLSTSTVAFVIHACKGCCCTEMLLLYLLHIPRLIDTPRAIVGWAGVRVIFNFVSGTAAATVVNHSLGRLPQRSRRTGGRPHAN